MTRVLCVEDDRRLRASVVSDLEDAGLDVSGVGSAEEARPLLEGPVPPELLLLDVRLPGQSGIDLVQELAAAGRLPATIVVTGQATISETVKGLRLGVLDFIEKPFSRERLLTSLNNAMARVSLEREVRRLEAASADEGELLGDSAPMCALRERLVRAAASNARVLVRGPSGSGKELVASALHRLSPRRGRPLVKLNCAAIPPNLIEDELFGHAKGAFTGASSAKPGLFEEADSGTLVLDEIGDMDLALQGRLLRVLEDGKVRRVGDVRERAVDVRVIAVTNRNLEEMVGVRRFREDLYFRLAHLPIDVPPLASRPGDVRLLATHFVCVSASRQRVRERPFSEAALQVMERYAWPGNVRELRNLCERLVVFGAGVIRPEELPPEVLCTVTPAAESVLRLDALSSSLTLRELRDRCEREFVLWALARCGWNVTAASQSLGLVRTALHDKLAAMGIRRPSDPSVDA